MQLENRTLAVRVVQLQSPTVRPRDSCAESKAETRPAILGRSRAVSACKAGEQLVAMFRGHAWSFVADLQVPPATGLIAAQGHGRARRRVPDRVIDEVVDHAAQESRVG